MIFPQARFEQQQRLMISMVHDVWRSKFRFSCVFWSLELVEMDGAFCARAHWRPAGRTFGYNISLCRRNTLKDKGDAGLIYKDMDTLAGPLPSQVQRTLSSSLTVTNVKLSLT